MQGFAGDVTEWRGGMARPSLVVGLVNSMPGEALRNTERQFRDILAAAARDVTVRLRFFTLDDTVLRGAGRDPAGPHYEDLTALRAADVDALIVTGMPPRAASLRDEPLWPYLVAVLELAVMRELPTAWLCLAAHAAVLHLDGIERRRMPRKLSGLVACTRADGHPLVAGLPRHWRLPHSRYNDLPVEALTAHGYRLLSWSEEAGADLFTRDVGAPFLFCQGHPEYDAATLLREYHRDIRQYLAGSSDTYPAIPSDYVGAEVAALLAAFRATAERARQPGTIANFPMQACLDDVAHSWRDIAHGLYSNFLGLVAERKLARSAPAPLASTRAA
jgi:homoserine O-succinyltransferase